MSECTLNDPAYDLDNPCYHACRATRDGECFSADCPASGDRFNGCPLARVCRFHGKPQPTKKRRLGPVAKRKRSA